MTEEIARPQPLPDSLEISNRPRWDWFAVLGPYLGLLLIVALFGYLTWYYYKLDLFLSLSNLRLITLHASVIATVALGMTLIMISGGIDLSVGYVISLVTVITVLAYNLAAASKIEFFSQTASIWAILVGLLTGIAAGLFNGLIITRLKIMPFVATLGMMGVARGLGQHLARGTRVTFRDSEPPGWVTWLQQIEPKPAWLVVSPSVWSLVLLAIAAAILLRYTVLGRHCYAIGSNELTARLCGIPVERTKIILYTLAGLATGWAGIIQTARSGAGTHDVGAGLELEVIAAVVIGGGSLIGGQGTVVGTLIGAMILAVLQNGCSLINLPNEIRFGVIGLIIIAVAALNQWRQRQFR